MQGSASGADMAEGTISFNIEQAVIESFAHGARFFSGDMFADFFRDRGTVFTKDHADLPEGSAFIEFRLDDSSGFEV